MEMCEVKSNKNLRKVRSDYSQILWPTLPPANQGCDGILRVFCTVSNIDKVHFVVKKCTDDLKKPLPVSHFDLVF